MVAIEDIGIVVKERRKGLGKTQLEVATQARVSRARLAALENQKLSEIGFDTLTRILHVIGLDLRVTELNRQRPTLEDLVNENKKR